MRQQRARRTSDSSTNNVSATTVVAVQVEIKALRMEGRQVSRTLYQQIFVESLLNPDDASLRGTPWGRVNVHLDCEDLEDDHEHVLWLKGASLRRAVVLADPRNDAQAALVLNRLEEAYHDAAACYLAALALEGYVPLNEEERSSCRVPNLTRGVTLSRADHRYWSLCNHLWGIWTSERDIRSQPPRRLAIRSRSSSSGGSQIESLSQVFDQAAEERLQRKDAEWPRAYAKQSREQLHTYFAERNGAGKTAKDLWQEAVLPTEHLLAAYEHQWEQQVQALTHLEQFYIGV